MQVVIILFCEVREKYFLLPAIIELFWKLGILEELLFVLIYTFCLKLLALLYPANGKPT